MPSLSSLFSRRRNKSFALTRADDSLDQARYSNMKIGAVFSLWALTIGGLVTADYFTYTSKKEVTLL